MTEAQESALAMGVFTTSAAMVGVCLTAIGILRVVAIQGRVETIGDELLAIDSAVFLLTCLTAFWSFKTRHRRRREVLRITTDALFLIALLIMVVVCAAIAYALA